MNGSIELSGIERRLTLAGTPPSMPSAFTPNVRQENKCARLRACISTFIW